MSPRPKATSDAELLAAAHRVIIAARSQPHARCDVAREARVSAATLVQRFGSKRGLLLAFAAQRIARSRRGVRADPPDQRVGARRHLCDRRLHGGDGADAEMLANSVAFLQLDLSDPEFHKHAHAHSRATQAEIKALLDEAVAAGDLSLP